MAKSEEKSKETEPSFDWKTYLEETGGIPAPAEGFYQWPDPPKNQFEEDMILEAYDPRFPSIKSAAEVTAVYGAKIRLRMVGAVGYDDIWVLIDSPQIRPYGTTQSQGALLQPPFNCRLDASRFGNKLKQVLSHQPVASKDIFPREPPKPASNLFQVGHRLEACDPRNPTFICPATVRQVREEKVQIEFDGWNTLDWVRYDSRDLFPIGWWAKSGAAVQPPKQTKAKRSNTSSVETPNKTNSANKAKEAGSKRSKAHVRPTSTAGVSNDADVLEEKRLVNLFESANSILTTTPSSLKKKRLPVDDTPSKKQSEVNELQLDTPPKLQAEVSQLQQQQHAADGVALKVKARKTIASALSAAAAKAESSATTAPPSLLVELEAETSPKPSVTKSSSETNRRSTIDDILDAIVASKTSHLKNRPLSSMSGDKTPAESRRPSSAAGGSVSSGVATTSGTKKRMLVSSPGGDSCSTLDGTPDTSDFVIYLNPTCAVGQWLDAAKVRNLGVVRFGPGGVNHVMRSGLQALVDCALFDHAAHVLRAVQSATTETASVGQLCLTADASGLTLTQRLPFFGSALDAWKFLSAALDQLHTCPHLLSKRFDGCSSCPEGVGGSGLVGTGGASLPNGNSVVAKKIKMSPTVDALSLDTTGRVRHISGGSSSSTCTDRDFTAIGIVNHNEDLTKWSVDDVARFVNGVSDSVTAEVFRKQEIDGKALLLLSADMMIRYMNVRLGPALKISSGIDKLKNVSSGIKPPTLQLHTTTAASGNNVF